MLTERKVHMLEFNMNSCSTSDNTGENSRAKNSHLTESVKTLKINDRASPIPFRPQNHHKNQIFKSKSGQSIKDVLKSQT